MNLTCIICPKGCALTYENGLVSGNACKRGAEYAVREATAPMRDITTTLPVSNRRTPVSVKTSAPIPKEAVLSATEEIRTYSVTAPIRRGDVLIRNICGVDLIATATVL